VPYIAPAYRSRLQANVTDTYTSVTFLKVNRKDSTFYTLTIISSTRERATSRVEISVECKYNNTKKTIYIQLEYILVYRFFSSNRERAKRQVGISVDCKYMYKIDETIYT